MVRSRFYEVYTRDVHDDHVGTWTSVCSRTCFYSWRKLLFWKGSKFQAPLLFVTFFCVRSMRQYICMFYGLPTILPSRRSKSIQIFLSNRLNSNLPSITVKQPIRSINISHVFRNRTRTSIRGEFLLIYRCGGGKRNIQIPHKSWF